MNLVTLRIVNDIQVIFSLLKGHKALTVPIKILPEGPITKCSVVNCTQIGGRSSAIRAGSRLEGLADNAQGRNSSCLGGVPGLEEDSYLKLRSDFLREFKSMSALFQRCQPAPEGGIRRSPADEQ
ncbi:hypothetical protein KBP51_06745 [Lactiplantibacillus pentosus]|uniref:hypothetical protein n=1 Tax=Lactiplantibacillus pentosus TaxID=1589 RepID=UPI0013302745|nr:hypothetical protein [Lactiplantibacillus pentosus]MBQ0836163.1 hypothetical protein [Lactiplantibacillus pentosus]